MDGSQGGFTSSVDNVFQQSLSSDTPQIGDWQVCHIVMRHCHDRQHLYMHKLQQSSVITPVRGSASPAVSGSS